MTCSNWSDVFPVNCDNCLFKMNPILNVQGKLKRPLDGILLQKESKAWCSRAPEAWHCEPRVLLGPRIPTGQETWTFSGQGPNPALPAMATAVPLSDAFLSGATSPKSECLKQFQKKIIIKIMKYHFYLSNWLHIKISCGAFKNYKS